MVAKSSSKSISATRCWPLALIFGSGLLALCAVQFLGLDITGKPTRDISLIIGATELVAYIWIRELARASIAGQLKIGAVVIALQAVVYFCVRIDGFMGDGRLMLSWRWATTPEQTFASSRRSTAAAPRKPSPMLEPQAAEPSDFPGFRGRDRSGIVGGVRLKLDWQAHPPQELWRRPVGRGWSSFAVVGDRCVTQEQRGEFEVVVCYAIRTGREMWVHRDRACFDEVTGGRGPRATPTIENGRAFALGATGILNCLDLATGQRLWSIDILESNHVPNCLFGMAGSPLTINGMVVVSPGGRGSSLVAYDQQTGALVWSGGDASASYSSPQFAALSCGNQVLNFNAEGLYSHDVDTGRVLWNVPWVSNPAERNNVCQPIPLPASSTAMPDRVLISSGYDKGSALLMINRHDGRFQVDVRWSNRLLKSKFASMVLCDGMVYGLDNGILACVDCAASSLGTTME